MKKDMDSVVLAPGPALAGKGGRPLERMTASSLLTPVALVAGVWIYAAALQWIYATIVAPQFGYLGYNYIRPGWPVTAATIGGASGLVLLLPRSIERVSHVVVWVLFTVCVAPNMLVGAYSGYLSDREALTSAAIIGLSFGIVAVGVRRPMRKTALPIGLRPATVWIFLAAFSALTYGLMLATFGLRLQFVALADVYDVRADYKDEIAGSGLLGYLISPQANIVNPYLIGQGILTGKRVLIAVGFVGQLFIYSASGFKTVLFATPAVLLMAFLFRERSRRRPAVLLYGPILLMLASAVADQRQGDSTWTSLFARRFLITPGFLTSVYERYFSDNPPTQFAQSILRWWSPVRIDPPPRSVGQFLSPGSQLMANANIFGDGFANFGWWGVFGAGLGLLIFLRILDHASRGLPLALSATVMIMPSITLSNSAFLTSLLSHGVAAGVALLALAPRPAPPPQEGSP